MRQIYAMGPVLLTCLLQLSKRACKWSTWAEIEALQVALRGERERAAPDFYHHILRLKRQLREDGIQDVSEISRNHPSHFAVFSAEKWPEKCQKLSHHMTSSASTAITCVASRDVIISNQISASKLQIALHVW